MPRERLRASPRARLCRVRTRLCVLRVTFTPCRVLWLVPSPVLQAAFLTNGLPLPPGSPCEDGRNLAVDPSLGTLCTLRKVTGVGFK